MGTSAVPFCCLHGPKTFSADTASRSTATQHIHQSTFWLFFPPENWCFECDYCETLSMFQCEKKKQAMGLCMSAILSTKLLTMWNSGEHRVLTQSGRMSSGTSRYDDWLSLVPLPGTWKLQEKTGTDHAWHVDVGYSISTRWFACWFFGPACCSPRPQARNDAWGKQLRSDLVSSPGVKKSEGLGWPGKEFCVQVSPGQRRDSSHAETPLSSSWQVKWWTSETERTCGCLLQLSAELTMVSNGCWKSSKHFTAPAPQAGRFRLPGQSLERSASVSENRVLIGDFVSMAVSANAG